MSSNERLAKMLAWIKEQEDLVTAYKKAPTTIVLGELAARAVRDGVYSGKTVRVDIFPRLKRYLKLVDDASK